MCSSDLYTRIIEHKHFEFGKQPSTIITYEYPDDFEKGKEPYYPVNDEDSRIPGPLIKRAPQSGYSDF